MLRGLKWGITEVGQLLPLKDPISILQIPIKTFERWCVSVLSRSPTI